MTWTPPGGAWTACSTGSRCAGCSGHFAQHSDKAKAGGGAARALTLGARRSAARACTCRRRRPRTRGRCPWGCCRRTWTSSRTRCGTQRVHAARCRANAHAHSAARRCADARDHAPIEGGHTGRGQGAWFPPFTPPPPVQVAELQQVRTSLHEQVKAAVAAAVEGVQGAVLGTLRQELAVRLQACVACRAAQGGGCSGAARRRPSAAGKRQALAQGDHACASATARPRPRSGQCAPAAARSLARGPTPLTAALTKSCVPAGAAQSLACLQAQSLATELRGEVAAVRAESTAAATSVEAATLTTNSLAMKLRSHLQVRLRLLPPVLLATGHRTSGAPLSIAARAAWCVCVCVPVCPFVSACAYGLAAWARRCAVWRRRRQGYTCVLCARCADERRGAERAVGARGRGARLHRGAQQVRAPWAPATKTLCCACAAPRRVRDAAACHGRGVTPRAALRLCGAQQRGAPGGGLQEDQKARG